MAWCDDPNHKKYNQEIKVNNKNLKENLYRKDHKVRLYNLNKP